MGGISREREVSIESGKCVAEALKQAGVNVVVADVKPDALGILDDETIDVFFIALHGTFGEDGQIQEIFESKGLIYTGSGPSGQPAGVRQMGKQKNIYRRGQLQCLTRFCSSRAKKTLTLRNRFGDSGTKYVVKPLREGSTIGISIADDPKPAVAAAKKCAAEFGDCMIERFIKGREITVSILGKEALPILEIRPRAGFYDYHAKYIDDKTEYLFDSINNPALVDKIQKSAIDCFNSLGCRGVARVDFIIGDDGKPYVARNQHHSGNDEPFAFAESRRKIGHFNEPVVSENRGDGPGRRRRNS